MVIDICVNYAQVKEIEIIAAIVLIDILSA